MLADTQTRRIIQELVEKIKKAYEPKKIILFGSYAYGAPDKDSDIDLLIIKDTDDRPIDRRTHVRGIITDRQRLIPVAPIVLTSAELRQRMAIGDQFLQEIMEKGEILYEQTGIPVSAGLVQDR